MIRHGLPTLLLVSILLLAREGVTSEIAFREVSGSELAETASFIVEATYRKDGRVEERGARKFERVVALAGSEKVSGTIAVSQASDAAWAAAERAYKTSGVRRSPIVSELAKGESATLVDGGRYILFLNPGASPSELVLAAENAWIDASRLKELKKSSPRLKGSSPP